MHLTLLACVFSAITLCHFLHISACYRITQVVMTSTVLPDDATAMCDVLFDAKHRTGRTAVRVPDFPTLEELGPFWVSLEFIPVNLFVGVVCDVMSLTSACSCVLHVLFLRSASSNRHHSLCNTFTSCVRHNTLLLCKCIRACTHACASILSLMG
jgi:hypothetical protein